MATRLLVSPVAGRAQTGAGAYGWRTHPVTGEKNVFHAGDDIACPEGTPVYAPEPGVIVAAGTAGSGLAAGRSGLFVLMRGDWTGRDHYIGHCSQLIARAGRRVEQLERIALSGSTGNVSGPHAHVEVRTAGTLTTHNPAEFYAAHGVRLGSDPGENTMTPAQEKKLDALVTAVNALTKALTRLPAAVWGYRNKKLDRRDAFAILRNRP